MLVLLFFLVSILSVSFILWPLKRLADHRGVSAAKPLFVYFCSIGLGFMLIEIALMQRLNLFLGHPIYGLSVVLFSLLLSCGIGSYLTEFCKESTLRKAALGRLGMLLALLTLMGFGLQPLLHTSVGFQTWMRILISIAALFPAGLLMGAAFPLGMMLANRSNAQHLTPWFWGLNGAMSVVSSVLAVMLSVLISITAAFWTGTACYLLATVMFAVHDARHPNGIHPTIKKGET
jgi:predicted membrane-bound spermidine synthase